ncbi:hypothetical protein ACPF7Z_09110 [Halomonas sp. GXIMD04776]|uniref:hypothetical protein n=1 Tax=Halomonas sp. GXIMD04776 TaxID=3415605 RepID=UPI003C815EB7
MQHSQHPDDENTFRIEKNHWYAWQTIPSDLDGNRIYYSPVHVTNSALKGGNKSHIMLAFTNVLYLDGSQDFHVNLNVLQRFKDILVADLLMTNATMRSIAILSRIDFAWLQQHCRHVLDQYPPSLFGPAAEGDVATYLDRAFPYVHSRVTLPRRPMLDK